MELKARVPGKVVEVTVKVGDSVKVKDVVAVMEAMKMKQKFPCPVEGTVKEIKVNAGDRVSAGDVIMVVE